MDDEYIIGIDLGTTYTCAAVMRNDRIEIIPDELGKKLVPSCVSFLDKRLIGHAAKNKASSNLKNTVYCVKRIIGRKYSDEIVQNDIKNFPFKIVEDEETDKPLIQVECNNNIEYYYPQQISAMILSHVKKYSEDFVGKKIKKAVITVPAYFNESQKKATKEAGEIAGLEVIRILNEPTAAAIAYGYQNNNELKGKKNILVFDLGGGTYDISILELKKNKFTVLSINGDSHLGGEDFDNKLLDFCIQEFKKQTGINIENNDKAKIRLKKECEAAKKNLSSSSSLEEYIEIDALASGEDFKINILKSQLEEICKELFNKLIPPINQVLEDAKLSENEIDDIILVGGSSRIPKIQEMLQEYFNNKTLNKTVNPDEVVAEGAALQAYILQRDNNIKIININPISLGIKCDNKIKKIKHMMSVIIPKNTQLPCSRFNIYYTAYNNQTRIGVNVYQGEKKYIDDNYFLNSFRITGLRPAPVGEIKFNVKMELDENGILKVSAQEIGGEHYGEIQIEGVNDFTKEQIEFFKDKELKLQKNDKLIHKEIEKNNELTKLKLKEMNK